MTYSVNINTVCRTTQGKPDPSNIGKKLRKNICNNVCCSASCCEGNPWRVVQNENSPFGSQFIEHNNIYYY